jgi:FdhE protein
VQRVLDPAQIEAFAERQVPRIRIAERPQLFSQRAARLRHLSGCAPAGHGRAIGDYLRLMARVADAQHCALATLVVTRPAAEHIERSRAHGMPLVQAAELPREAAWRGTLRQICNALLESGAPESELPPAARAACARLCSIPVQALEAQADAALAARADPIEAASAPFIMSALQVYFLALASGFSTAEVSPLEVSGVCPLCGTLPVASIVRVDRSSQGYRYLHCALCATEWHLVRITCSHCGGNEDLGYYSIEGGSEAVRAEACPQCMSYRKILYQEKDTGVEPLADDLASVALDLMMSEAGYHRASGNPLLWM